jgi:hypothetical protein
VVLHLRWDAGRWWSFVLDGDEGIGLRFLPWQRCVDCVWGKKDMDGASTVHGKNDWAMGGPARHRQWDSCVLDCCKAWIASRGCVSFCGSDEIFSSMAEALIDEGIAARTMWMQG